MKLSAVVFFSTILVAPLCAQEGMIDVHAASPVATIHRELFGINTARWDESLFPGSPASMLLTCDRDAIAKIAASGVTLLKYPGGNDADSYIWNSQGNNETEMNTDEYIALCRQVGAEPFITVNFNASPELAADWVRYCRERGYNVRYWEVGDEQWGTWAKGHSSPEVYAQKYIAFVKAMRATDPEIKVATNVPLGIHPENWTTRVLKAAADYVDMVTVTFFPQQWGKENDDTLFTTTGRYAAEFSALKRDMEEAIGVDRARKIITVNVGYNSVNHSPGPQTVSVVNALWLADMLGTMAETGTDMACYWALHNAYPPRGGDYGYLSSEGSNTPHPSYYVFQLLSPRFSGNVLRCGSSDARVGVHASRDGKALCVFLVNKDSTAEHVVRVRVDGFQPGSSADRWLLGRNGHPAKQDAIPAGTGFSITLPPYSLTVLQMASADSVAPPANLATRARASASTSSTIGPVFGPDRAIDGNRSTRWCSAAWTNSNGNEAQWFELSWDTTVICARVVLRWGESPATVYTLEASSDGKRWTPLRQITEGRGGTEELTFPPQSVRYLRMAGTRGTKGISAYTLREMEVYGR